MAFEFTIEQKAADEILKLTEEIKNFNDQKVSQGDKKSSILGKNDSDDGISKTSLNNRNCRAGIQNKSSGNVDNSQREGSDESDQKIDINNYKDISITEDFRGKYGKYLDDKNLKEKEKLNVTEEIYKKPKIVDIKRGGVEGGAVVEQDGKKYMLKGLYKEKGKYLYKPNAKNSIHAFFTRKGIDGINKSVIEEYVALKLANIVHKGISPDVKLGKIEHKDNNKGGDCKYQYCLMTEIAGQEEGETFNTLEKFFKKNENTDSTEFSELNQNSSDNNKLTKEIWQNAFAVSVCLLNDRDVNKVDNIGVVYKDEKATKLSLFDLGHPTPDKYELDPKTLLPKSMNVLEKVALWIMNLFVKTSGLPWTFKMNDKIIEQLGEPEDRAKTTESLISEKNKNKIFETLDDIEGEFKEYPADKERIKEFKSKIEKRFAQLKNVLDGYNDKYKKANEKQGVEIEMVDLSFKQA